MYTGVAGFWFQRTANIYKAINLIGRNAFMQTKEKINKSIILESTKVVNSTAIAKL